MSEPEKYDAVIIGAGIIGCAVALELSRMGHRTVNVDMLPAAGYGSTSNSCAIIRFHYSTEHHTAFAYDGSFYWKDWSGYLDNPGGGALAEFRETGCLVLKTEGNGFLRKIVANMEALSIPHEHWDTSKIQSRFPFYDMRKYGPPRLMNDPGFGEPTGGSIAGGVFFPTAGYISDPQLSTLNIQNAAESNGSSFRFNSKVVDMPVSGNRVQGVLLDDGSWIEAPVVINVAGPHSALLNKLVGADRDMKISTKALKQEVVHIPAPEGFDFEKDGMIISDNDIGVYCRPEVGNHILAGSEDPDCDEREWVDPNTFDRNFSDQSTTQVLRLAQRMSNLRIPSRNRGVVDLYDVTDDWRPIYDRSAVDGYYMACGSSGNQFKNAPVAGKLMAQLVEYCESGNDHDRNPMQLQLRNIDYVLDTATMSRLRAIDPESSFPVLG